MYKLIVYISLFICCAQQFHSQEDGVVALDLPVRNSLRFNRYAINPTFSFVREQNRFINISHKQQWAQFEDAPQTFLFGYSGRFKENIGAGLGLFQQNYGVLTTFGGIANFAYNAAISRESNVTFGLNVGFYSSTINDGKVTINFPDPSLDNIQSNSILTINPGINYGTGFFDFGLSVNNLVAYNLTNSQMIEENPEQNFQAHILYTGYMNSSGFFDQTKFQTLLRSEFKKDQTVLSGLAMLVVPKGIWSQIGYNTMFGVSAGVGLNITEAIAVEYNYEQAIGDISVLGNSHQITLAYKIKSEQRFNYGEDDEELSLLTSSRRSKRVLASSVPASKKNLVRTKRERTVVKEPVEVAKAAEEPTVPEKTEEELIEEQRLREIEIIAKKREEERLRAEAEEISNQEALERQRLQEEARLKAAEAEKLRLAEQEKLKAAAEAKAKKAEATRIKTEQERLAKLEEARLKAEAEAKAKREEEARMKAEQERIAKQQEEARLQAEKERAEEAARIKAEEERLAREAQIEAEKIKRARLAEEARLKAEQEEQERIVAAEEANKKVAQERATVNIEKDEIIPMMELDGVMVPVPGDTKTREMNGIAVLTSNSKIQQENLLNQLRARVAGKQKDLDDLKEENDLSEKGIVNTKPKVFKSISAENALLQQVQNDLDNVIASRGSNIAKLETLYNERLKTVKDKTEQVNQYYRQKIQELKSEQTEAVQARTRLISNLERINVATEIERKRRIKRAAYDNEQARYEKDRVALQVIKQNTPVSDTPLTVDNFDSGQVSSNIQIVKGLTNTDNGYYMVVAVHSDVDKRDEFLRKAVAAGESNINFFFDVNTNKYYIYYDKYESLNAANQALNAKGTKPYNANMSMVKVEN